MPNLVTVYPGIPPNISDDLSKIPMAHHADTVKGKGLAILSTKKPNSILSKLSSLVSRKEKTDKKAVSVGGNRRQLRSTKRINKLHKSKTYRKKSKTYRKKSKTYRKKS